MRILGIFLTLLTSAAVVRVLPPIVNFCSGGDDDEISRPAFLFDPELSNGQDLRPLYFTWNQFYDQTWLENDGRADNIQEWKKYFENALTENDLALLIYGSDKNFIQRLQHSGAKPADAANDTGRSAFFTAFFNKYPHPDFLQYLYFAKECEPCVSEFREWADEKQVQQCNDTMATLLERGKEKYRACRSDFLKLRYGFQIVRLAHYLGRYAECIDLYDHDIAPLKTESMISYWALEHKAGAMLKLKKEAEAAYYFSVVFDRCPGRRFVSYQSFNVTTDSSWEATLSLCKTPHEKTTLYFLRAMNPRAYVLEEMKNIYGIDSSSIHLNVLLVRDINKFEERYLNGNSERRSYLSYASSLNPSDLSYLRDLKSFVVQCGMDNKIRNRDLWTLAGGYIEFLLGDCDKAQRAYGSLQSTQDSRIKSQLPIFKLAASITSAHNLSRNLEDNLFSQVLSWQHEKLLHYTIDRLERLATLGGDTVKAYLCKNSLENFQQDFDLEFVEKTIDWVNRPGQTIFEKYIAGNRLSSWNKSITPLDRLLELKGTILFSEGRLQEAIATYKQISETDGWTARADPFSSRITDCRDCDFEKGTSVPYDKLGLAETILGYEKKIKSDPSDAARYHYLLGNAYYNITHFGNSAEAILYNRDPNQSFVGMPELINKAREVPVQFDCSRSEEHYRAGMKLAEASGNFELAAECCFMAAKCEQNLYYVSVNEDHGKIKREKFRTNFKLLKDKYAATKFYLRALDECKYFHSFAENN